MRVWRIGRTLVALGGLGLGFLALSQPARAQTAEETVLFLLTGETQAPKANGRFAIDTKGETTVFFREKGDNIQVVFHTLWRLQPLDACRYRLFRLNYATRPDGTVVTEAEARRNLVSALEPSYIMSEFDFRKLVTADVSRFGRGYSTKFTFTEAFEATAQLDPASVSGGRMVAFDASEFPVPTARPVMLAGGKGAGFETRFGDAVKYLQSKYCPKASAF